MEEDNSASLRIVCRGCQPLIFTSTEGPSPQSHCCAHLNLDRRVFLGRCEAISCSEGLLFIHHLSKIMAGTFDIQYIYRQNLDEDEQRYFQEMEDAFNHPDVLDVKRMVFDAPILVNISLCYASLIILIFTSTQIEEGYLHPHESNLPSLPNAPHAISLSTTSVNPSITTLVNTPPVFQLNDFLIVGELGKGASGSVYKIQDKLTSAFLALKVIHKKGLTTLEIEDAVDEQVALQKMAGEFGFLQLEASFHDSENFYLATVSREYSPFRVD